MSLVESVLMLEEDPKTPVPEELLLTDEDFPAYFVDNIIRMITKSLTILFSQSIFFTKSTAAILV